MACFSHEIAPGSGISLQQNAAWNGFIVNFSKVSVGFENKPQESAHHANNHCSQLAEYHVLSDEHVVEHSQRSIRHKLWTC